MCLENNISLETDIKDVYLYVIFIVASLMHMKAVLVFTILVSIFKTIITIVE